MKFFLFSKNTVYLNNRKIETFISLCIMNFFSNVLYLRLLNFKELYWYMRLPFQYAARDSPAIMCHTPHHAATNAIPPTAMSGGNMAGLKINMSAIPEF